MYEADVRVVDGSTGFLVRGPSYLLFIEAQDPRELHNVVGGRSGEAAFDALADWLTAERLSAPPFVFIDWTNRLQVMVFGDITLSSDDPSMPLLTASSSESWIERTVRSKSAVSIRTAGASAHPLTRLSDGMVPAGGFEIGLRPLGAAQVPAIKPQDAHEPEPSPPEAESAEAAAALTTETADATPDREVMAPEQPAWGPVGAAPGAMAYQADPTPTPSTPPSPGKPTPREVVEARSCPTGHANPPTLTACRICESAIGNDVPMSEVPRPSLGRLVLDDGTSVELTSNLVLGRAPDEYTGPLESRRVAVDGELVSRAHLEVRLHQWAVEITDLGTPNGTYVESNNREIRLPPGERLLIEPGTTVVLGDRLIRYEAPND